MTRFNKVCVAFSVLAFVAIASGCTTRVGDFTLISTKNIDLSDAEVDVRTGRRVTEQHCIPIVLIFPLGRPDLETAVDKALESGQGNIMVDQVSYYRHWYIPLLFGQQCMVAEGTVVRVSTRNKS